MENHIPVSRKQNEAAILARTHICLLAVGKMFWSLAMFSYSITCGSSGHFTAGLRVKCYQEVKDKCCKYLQTLWNLSRKFLDQSTCVKTVIKSSCIAVSMQCTAIQKIVMCKQAPKPSFLPLKQKLSPWSFGHKTNQKNYCKSVWITSYITIPTALFGVIPFFQTENTPVCHKCLLKVSNTAGTAEDILGGLCVIRYQWIKTP